MIADIRSKTGAGRRQRSGNIIQSGKMAMGVLLVTAGLMGCKSAETSFGLNPERLDKTRAAILAEIPEVERRQSMLAVVDLFDVETQKIAEDIKGIRQRIVEANRSYDTTREQLQQMYDELGAQLDRLGQTTKEHSLKLRALCSKAEWEAVFAHDDDAVNFNF